jgi:hypothetical protein
MSKPRQLRTRSHAMSGRLENKAAHSHEPWAIAYPAGG